MAKTEKNKATTKTETKKADKPEAKPAKVKKPKAIQLPKALDEMSIDEQTTFLTANGHMGPDIEPPTDITGYIMEGFLDKTFRDGKKSKVKKEKVEPVYEWQEKSKYAGRQCFPSCGTSHILRETTDGNHFEVKRISDETVHVVKAATTRFKAVNEAYRDKYVKDDSIRTASGSPSVHTGDDVSTSLLGTNLAELSGIAKENELADAFERWSNSNKNPGMIRMNLGNVLRARVKRGEAVSIFGIGDIKLAAQKGAERGAKEARELAERKAAAKKLRDEADAEKKAEKAKIKAEAAAKKAEKEAQPKKEKPVKAKPELAKPSAKKAV